VALLSNCGAGIAFNPISEWVAKDGFFTVVVYLKVDIIQRVVGVLKLLRCHLLLLQVVVILVWKRWLFNTTQTC